jgi:4-hydroxy-3-polyprenylbenzoate decarboxylase
MDLREYMEALEEAGELKTIEEEIHWDLEAGIIASMSNRVGGPAVHFKNVKGYPNCSLVGSLFSGPGTLYPYPHPKGRSPWKRMAIAMEMDKDIGYEDLQNEILSRRRVPILPNRVSIGECKEVIKTGDQVDLFEFPFPYLHSGDGGRYGTAGIIVAKDRGSDWINWAVHRFMINDKNTIVLNISPNSQTGLIFKKYENANEPMPCTIVMGGNPVCFLAAATTVPIGVSEAELAGSYAQEPVSLLRGELNEDLLIPADAELVLEGKVIPHERLEEGPFPEYVRWAERTPKPVMKVETITHRENPIIPFVAEGQKVSDSMAIRSVLISTELMYKCLTERKFPVRWINLPVEMKLGMVVVATQVPFRGYNHYLTKFLLAQKRWAWFDKIFLVDSDLEAVDMYEILNDFAQKVDNRYGKGVWVEDGYFPLSPLAAYATPEEREKGAVRGCIVIDSTWADDRKKDEIPVRVTFENCIPKEIQEQVLEKWHKYGFKTKPYVKPVYEKWTRSLLISA